jgi:anti-sigma factor ChrR (cupin superfamily)
MTFLPSCQDVQTHLTEYAEGSLPLSRRLGIWVHLRLCKACARFLRGLKALPGLAKRALAPPKETPGAARTALAEVQAALAKRLNS